MEHFLNKENYEFYKKDRSRFPENYFIRTNKGLYKEEPSDEDKKEITHILTLNTIKNSKYKFYNYPNLQFLNYYGYMKNINFSRLPNLNTLVLHFSNTETKNLLNLPNIKTLIFRDTCRFLICRKEREFMLDNLPITLEELIFIYDNSLHKKEYDNEINNLDKTIEYLKGKMDKFKIPFGCKMYYIDVDKKIHTIAD